MRERFEKLSLDDSTVQVDDQLPTGTVTMILEGKGVPQFTINNGAAWDHLKLANEALDAVRGARAVCFGTLAQRKPSRSYFHPEAGGRDTVHVAAGV